MLFGQPNQLPEEVPSTIEDVNLRKRAKYLGRCKDVLWTRWRTEYLKALRKRHNLNNEVKETTLSPGGGTKQRAVKARNSRAVDPRERCRSIRGIRLRTGKSYLERPVQHLNPLELSCDRPAQERGTTTQRPCSRVSTQTCCSSCTRTNSCNCNR